MDNRLLRVTCAGLLAAGTFTATTAGAPQRAGASPPKIRTVISGLSAPRGLTFDADGNLYVAESGAAGSGTVGLTTTGRVTKFARGSWSTVWRHDFESLYVTFDPAGDPDVLGPEGMSALSDSCRNGDGKHDRGSRRTNDCVVRMIMSESHDGVLAESGGFVDSTQLGHLFSLDAATGAATDLADVGDQQYQWTYDHSGLFPGDFPDSNPFGILVTRDRHDDKVRTFVADAGANTILEIMPSGTARVIAFIPNETAVPLRDATPTCIAEGPDGMLYVATLHIEANFTPGVGPNVSDVWRVDPDANFPAAPTVWATGLTTPTGCTFDDDGNFWAAEMFESSVPGPPGDIVRIPFEHPAQHQRIGGGQIPFPASIVQGRDGAMYVTVNATAAPPGSGAVLRVDTDS